MKIAYSNIIDGFTMDLSGRDLLIWIVECVIFCAAFIIGVYLQVKVIAVLKRDQAMTWEINFVHSVVMIFHFSFVSIFNAVNYIQISFYNYQLFDDPLFRYLVLSVMFFGISEMGFHSLYISIYKYIFIIHRETVIRIGEKRTKTLLLWTYFTGLIAWTLAYIVRPNFDPLQNNSGSNVSSGTTNTTSIQSAIDSFTLSFVSCGIKDLEPQNVGNIIVNVLTKVLCTGQVIITYAVSINVLEIFFYLRIFGHMNR